MGDSYHIAVVGAGSAGLSAAALAVQLGARVALVERGRVGGDCTWTGCVPSKTLIHAAGLAHDARAASRHGIGSGEVRVDLDRVLERVRETIARVYAHETPEVLEAQGVRVLSGQARFRSMHTLEVAGKPVRARRVILCTGARPTLPALAGLDDTPYLTYENVFTLHAQPERLIVLGGGPQGVELAQAFVRLGSEVTLLTRASRLLPATEPEASEAAARVLREDGVTVRLRIRATRVASRGGGVRLDHDAGGLDADAVLLATGRAPELRSLELDRAGVRRSSDGGVAVDDRLRTSRRHIYAAGDCIGSFQFTHYAGWQGTLAARNALLPGGERARRGSVPWTVFTDPEIAQVGLTERGARERGERVRTVRWDAEHIDRAQTRWETEGFAKIVTRARDGRVLGACIVASGASEVANELALAVERGLTAGEVARTIHIYPTVGTGVQQALGRLEIERSLRGWRGALLRALVRHRP